VTVSTAVAHEQHLAVGQRVRLPTPVPIALRVAALTSNLGWPPGAIVMNASDYARAWGSDDVSALLVTPAPGVSVLEARADLRGALGAHPGLVVQGAAERERAQRAASRSGLARLTDIATLVLTAAIIAMAAAMAGMIWQRRGFLAAMKVEGYSTAELWQSLLLEATVLVGAGCIVGAAFGLLGQRLLSRALMAVTGFPVEHSVAASCAGVTAVAVLIIAAFGQRAARIPAEAALQ
jgi:putative ABC transport system permease protein